MKTEVDQFLAGSLGAGALLVSLEPRFPWICEMEGTPQDPEWHGEGNVRIHTAMVLEALRLELEGHPDLNEDERLALVVGAALHDIGKTRTTKVKLLRGKERIVSPRHAEVGRSYAALRLADAQFSPEAFEWILGLIGYHHHPRKLIDLENSPGLFARISRSVPLRLLWIFERADLLGRICSDTQRQLEDLELFRLEAEQLGLWSDADPYRDWRSRLQDDLGIVEESEIDFVLPAARFHFEHGEIFALEEAIGKTWQARKHHGCLVLLCGPSGSGKSAWMESRRTSGKALTAISLDELREQIAGKRAKQSHNGQVFQLARERLKEALRKKETVVWDATNLRRDGRRALVCTAHDYGAATEIVRFAVTPAELARRNRKRAHDIPTAVLERQIERFEWPDLWEAQEVTTVRQGSAFRGASNETP